MLLLLAGFSLAAAVYAQPAYSPSTIVSAATNLAGPLAPNTIATIYGKDLATSTRTLRQEDIRNGAMPLGLPGSRTSVLVGGIFAPLYYVSPEQINFVIPASLLAGKHAVEVISTGVSGPPVAVTLENAAPGLFGANPRHVAAARLDGSVVEEAHPARPGEILLFYATGLGQTVPPVRTGEIAWRATPLAAMATFEFLLDGVAVPRENVLYAGLAPGYSGFYQINVRLPATLPADPTVSIRLAGRVSPDRLRLPLVP